MSLHDQVIEKKISYMNQLSDDIKESDALFFTEYRGLSVTQLNELKSSIRNDNATLKVMKNTLVSRVFKELKIECPEHVLKGPTALVISRQDCPKIASLIFKFLKGNEEFVIKGGYLDGAFLSEQDIKALSKLPSRDVLIGQLVGGLKSTINRFVLGVSSPLRGFVYVLEAIKNNKN